MIVIWNMGMGGIQKRVRDIIDDVNKRYPDWEIYLVIRRHKDQEINVQGSNHIHVLYYPFQGAIRMPLGFIFWFCYIYCTYQPTVLLTFLAQLSILVLFVRKIFFFIHSRIVLNEGAFTTTYLELNHMIYLKPFVRLFYPSADAMIVPTHAIKTDLSLHYGVDKGKIYVIPNWTLFKHVTPLVKTFDLLFIGRYETEKNPQLFISVVDDLRNNGYPIRAAMVGDGSLCADLKSRVVALGLSKCLLFSRFQQNVSELLRRSKILVMTSYNEGMPNVVLEAAMCRVPAVANNFKGVEEVIIHEKTGYITHNQQEMVVTITTVLNNPLLLRRAGMNARQYVARNFTYARQKEFIDILLH